MNKFLLIFLGLFLSQQVGGQVISGVVVDQKTNEKVSFAAIYFSGTMVGTISDINGDFELDVSKNASMPLSVSCMGYFSKTLNDYNTSEPLTIYLEPKEFKVDEITVTAKSLVRKKKSLLKLFEKEFLGTSINASSCEIENEEDIYFNYDSDTDTVRAFASNPIRIRNKALGYRITYFLDKFEYFRESKSFIFEGNIIFEEDLKAGNEAMRRACEERRKAAYLGSRMHFLRSLWDNNLAAAGFSITSSGGNTIGYNTIVVQEAGNIQDAQHQTLKFLSYPFPIEIFNGVEYSIMTLLTQRVYFEKSGYHSPGILWEGDMLKKRIGDALPYEYGMSRVGN